MKAGFSQIPFAGPVPSAPIAWNGIPNSTDSVLFVNTDINNTVYLGDRPSLSVGDLNTIPLPPNATVTLSADRTIYAVAAKGTANLLVIPGGGAYFQGLTQGSGQLVLPSMRSPNYVAGATGWSINKDGSVEFNNGTFRGHIVGGDLFLYTGTPGLGNPPIFSATSNAVDPFGNVVKPGGVAYITIASGTGAGRYAIQLGDQANPYAQQAALSFQNLTHPANLPPAVISQIDPAAGTTVELQSGQTLSTSKGTIISLHDDKQTGVPSIDIVADSIVISPDGTTTAMQLTGYHILGNQSAAPGSVVGAGVLFVDSTGTLRFIPDFNTADTNTYYAGRAMFTAAGQTVNSLTLANVTGIANIPVAAQRYHVQGMISLTQGGVTAVQKLGLTFTNASAMRIGMFVVESTSVETSATWTTAAASSQFSWPNGSVAELFFDGVVTFSAADSISLVVACITSAADTFVINSNSHMIIERV